MGSYTSIKTPEHIARVQSPSSINMYKQCPRKYYYRYVEKLPTFPSIHLVRGNVTHLALEKFFDTPVDNVPEESFFITMKVVLNELFKREWQAADFSELELSPERLLGYYDETKEMINNYFDYFTDKMKYFIRFLPIKEAWESVKPTREVEFISSEHYVRGFMDAIHDEAGKTLILDYKTSRKAVITPEYELQLSIYAMLYEEKFRLPEMVGIYFLKAGREMLLEATPKMVDRAKKEVMDVHLGTRSKEMSDYPKKPSGLCKWSTGQCDYYEYCFEGKELPMKASAKKINKEKSQISLHEFA